MTPERFRSVVSTILLVGVVASAALIGFGFATSFLVGWEGSLSGAVAGAGPLTDFGALGESLLLLRPIGFAQLGLVVLVLTPVARVAASTVGFLLEGDRLYAIITLVVLVVLLASLSGMR